MEDVNERHVLGVQPMAISPLKLLFSQQTVCCEL